MHGTSGKLRPRLQLTVVMNAGMQAGPYMQNSPLSPIFVKLAAVKTKTASAIGEDSVTSCIYDSPRKTWCHLSVLVRGWSEGSIRQKAMAEVAVGSLQSEKAEEDEAPARPEGEEILARIVGQGSSSHQNTIYPFLYSCTPF